MDVMGDEHGAISDILKKLEKTNIEGEFHDFHTTISVLTSSHFKLEEKKIQKEYELNTFEDQLLLNRMLNDHQEILSLILQLKKDFQRDNKINAKLLDIAMQKHDQFEQRHLYRRLSKKPVP